MRIAANLTAVLVLGVALFQAALALGAPWGEHSYGGRAKTDHGRLDSIFRVMSAVAVPVLVFAAVIVLSRAGTVSWFSSEGWVRAGTWLVFGYLVLNTLGNLASSSRIERFVMGGITLVAAVATLIVALG